MAISTIDGFAGAARQKVSIVKTVSRTSVAVGWFSLFDIAGSPGSGVLPGTSTANGVVPTDLTPGCPELLAFGAGADGYLTGVEFSGTVAARLLLADMVFKAGAYSFAAGTTALSSQPSYAGRMPGGSFLETGIWIEAATAFATGTAWQVRVTYTNQAGVTGRSTVITPSLNAAALTLGRMYQLPLQSGDSGVQAIESIVVTNGGTAMTAGTFNVLVLRPVWSNRVKFAGDGGAQGLLDLDRASIFADSALVLLSSPDSTGTGIPEVRFTVSNG